MTWREKTIIRILMFIAGMMAESDEVKKELSNLATHISVNCAERKP